MTELTFVRGHGLGNDYLVLETPFALTPPLVRQICDRHTGVGSDGILQPIEPEDADHGVRIWNPDGSVAEKSGNGIRIYARWLHAERGAADHFTVWTGTDRVACDVRADGITIEMGTATVTVETLRFADQLREVILVDVGNPHCVVFVDEPLDSLPWRSWGEAIESHERFPARTNVQIVRLHHGELHARIWERGAGETQASGSSSCAVVAAAFASGRVRRGTHTVHMPGGDLDIDVSKPGPDIQVVLDGPAELICRATVMSAWVEARQ